MSSDESSASSRAEKPSAVSSSNEEGENEEDVEGDEEIQCDICKSVIEGDAARFECLECNVRS